MSAINYGNVVAGATALPAGVNPTYFYARWTGYIVPTVSGKYTIGVNSQDGCNLYLGTVGLIRKLGTTQSANPTLVLTQSTTIELTAGLYYPFVLEWEHGTGANYQCQLAWIPPLGSLAVISTGHLSDSTASVTGFVNGTWWNGTPNLWYPKGNSFVDPTGSGVVMKGSVPPSANNGFAYTSTTSAISWTWQNNQSIFRPDATQVNLGIGGQAVTALRSGRTYYFYPYYDETAAALKWVDATAVSIPNITGVTFNGSTGYVFSSFNVSPANGGNLSVDAIFKTSAVVQQGILDVSTPQTLGTSTGEYFQLTMNASGTITAAVFCAGGVKTATSAKAYNDGFWHYIAAYHDGANNLTIYVDGVVDGTNAATGASSGVATCFCHVGAVAGRASWPATANKFFNGTLAQVSFGFGQQFTLAEQTARWQSLVNSGQSAMQIQEDNFPCTVFMLTDTSGTTAATRTSGSASAGGTYTGGFTLNQSSPVVVPEGSPAIAWPYQSFLLSQAQSNQGRTPLSSGAMNAATAAVGTGGGTGGGSTGGGFGGCFSGNTRVLTGRGSVPISQVRPGDLVKTVTGCIRKVKRVLVHELHEADRYPELEPGDSPIVQRRSAAGAWLMLDMGKGELVTLNHGISKGGKWPRAYEIFSGTVELFDKVFNLEIDADTEDDHSFVLANGHVAHNIAIGK